MIFLCWAATNINNDSVLKNSTLIRSVVRVNQFDDKLKFNQEFRYCRNKNGDLRILMLDKERVVRDGKVFANVTDIKFFSTWIDEVFKCNEISKDDYDSIKASLDSII